MSWHLHLYGEGGIGASEWLDQHACNLGTGRLQQQIEISLVHPPGAENMSQPVFSMKKTGCESTNCFFLGVKERVVARDGNPFFFAKKTGYQPVFNM